jgi:D-mannonate dehydratase
MMLSNHLEGAIRELQGIIDITKEDIEDIKQAKHDTQFTRLEFKNEKIKSFENKKAMIDYEISKLMSENPQSSMSELLNSEQHDLLDKMRALLKELHSVNKQYAKMVLTVSSFFTSLLEKVLPTEMNGYNKVASNTEASFLTVRV